jgi:diguanylate cyclase (GGDEF)-like protein/PAS domain S-box-containing protein
MEEPTAATPEPDSERRFERLVEHVPGMVVYLDVVQPHDPSASVPVYISPQVEELLGYEQAAWLREGELWIEVLHPEDRERMVAADAHARATLTPLFAEYRMLARDGRLVWVSEKASVVEDELTGTLYWQGVMVDITDRKRAEEALAVSERQLRAVFDAAAIGLMTLDLDGRMLDANAVLERVLGYPSGALNGLMLRGGFDVDDTAKASIETLAVGADDRCELEHRLRHHDGTPLWCRTVMVLVRDGSGRPDHVTAMVQDIDARKRAEVALVHRTIHDSLTALPNRQHFLERLAETRRSPLGFGLGVGVVFVDLDDFKLVNDSYGHAAGDELLVAIAHRLRATVRPADLVARFGGDEFLVLADVVGEPRDVAQLAWRLATSLKKPFEVGGRLVSVTASFGVAFSRDPDEADEDLVRKADAAMYEAKQRGRNRIAVFGRPEAEAGAVA